ncbi:MAG: hypothetical protein JW770_04010 [Actinobacteria bacterium]|nr:hypothetical protein [Actinomycetota bacterium]
MSESAALQRASRRDERPNPSLSAIDLPVMAIDNKSKNIILVCYNYKIMNKDILIKKNKIPASLQAILWSKDIKNIDYCHDRIYIIHQTLAYGDINEIKWLFSIYLKDEIKDTFINHPSRIYTRPVYFFIKDFILNIKKDINEKEYVKSITESPK